MKIAVAAALSLLVLSGGLATAQPPAAEQSAPPRAARTLPELGPATQPRPPRTPDRHNSFLEVARAGNIDLLFVGDSITDWWRQPQRGLPEWEKVFAPLNAANFGIAGDTTQGVLWRMQNGELEGFRADLIVLMIGTNNLRRNSVADIAAGNAAIIREFRTRQPQAEVLVLGVFPRGAEADNPLRTQIDELNYHLSHVADQPMVHYKDIGDVFLEADGTLGEDVMPDGLHPSLHGYELWSAAIIDDVRRLMN